MPIQNTVRSALSPKTRGGDAHPTGLILDCLICSGPRFILNAVNFISSFLYIRLYGYVSMGLVTPFGSLHVSQSVPKDRISAVERALEWCNTITEASPFWKHRKISKHVAVERQVNGELVTIFPVLAAKQDFGDGQTGFSRHHLPVMVNGKSVCVVPSQGITGRERSSLLHTDMVASLLQLFCVEHPPLDQLPRTLGKALYPKAFPGGRYDAMGHNPERARLQNRFQDEVTSDETAIEFFTHTDDQRWMHCRDLLDRHHHPNCTQFHAKRILSATVATNRDVLWALESLLFLDQDSTNKHLRRFMVHQNEDIAIFAVQQFQPADEKEACEAWLPLLQPDSEPSFWEVIFRLMEYPGSRERLLDRCQQIYEESEQLEFKSMLLAWLSNYRDMDEQVQTILSQLGSHQLPPFLLEVQTYGPWFEAFAFEQLQLGRSRLNHGVLNATIQNASFDHFRLWECLFNTSSGGVRTALMPHLANVGTDQAFRLIESQTNHELRFVSRRAYVWIASFKRHPRTGDVLLQGMESQYKGVRLECQRLLQLRRDEGLDP